MKIFTELVVCGHARPIDTWYIYAQSGELMAIHAHMHFFDTILPLAVFLAVGSMQECIKRA